MAEGVGHGVSLVLEGSGAVEVMAVLHKLDEMTVRFEVDDFDLCFVAFNSHEWLDQVVSRIPVHGGLKKRFVIGTSRLTSEVVLSSLRLGANAVADMGSSTETIIHLLHQVVSGRIDLTKNNSVEEIHRMSPEVSILRHCRDNLDFLILSLLIEGKSNEQIADKCDVALQTVRNRLVRLMREANVDNRTHLATSLLRD